MKPQDSRTGRSRASHTQKTPRARPRANIPWRSPPGRSGTFPNTEYTMNLTDNDLKALEMTGTFLLCCFVMYFTYRIVINDQN